MSLMRLVSPAGSRCVSPICTEGDKAVYFLCDSQSKRRLLYNNSYEKLFSLSNRINTMLRAEDDLRRENIEQQTLIGEADDLIPPSYATVIREQDLSLSWSPFLFACVFDCHLFIQDVFQNSDSRSNFMNEKSVNGLFPMELAYFSRSSEVVGLFQELKYEGPYLQDKEWMYVFLPSAEIGSGDIGMDQRDFLSYGSFQMGEQLAVGLICITGGTTVVPEGYATITHCHDNSSLSASLSIHLPTFLSGFVITKLLQETIVMADILISGRSTVPPDGYSRVQDFGLGDSVLYVCYKFIEKCASYVTGMRVFSTEEMPFGFRSIGCINAVYIGVTESNRLCFPLGVEFEDDVHFDIYDDVSWHRPSPERVSLRNSEDVTGRRHRSCCRKHGRRQHNHGGIRVHCNPEQP